MHPSRFFGWAALPAVLCAQGDPAPTMPLTGLPIYTSLLTETRARNPEWQRSHAALEAARAQVPQAGALPDPELSLGMQRRVAMDVIVGAAPTGGESMPLMGTLPAGTEFSLMGSQSLPWPGKRSLRTEMAKAALARAEAAQVRMQLDLEASVQTALLDWLKTRAELGLLEMQARLSQQAEALAKTRGEQGAASQSDLLQAMMTGTRLLQRRLRLENQEADARAALNRLSGRDPDAALEPGISLEALAKPAAPGLQAALEDTWRRSPEWKADGAEQAQAKRALELAHKELRPDFRVSAGLMKESGMGTGWKAEVGFSLPIFAGRKQQQAIAQRRAERAVVMTQQEALRQDLELRTRERLRAWNLAERQARLFEEALLPQGDLNFQSLLGQYEAGRVAFGNLLEALDARLRDRLAHLEALAQLQRLAVAQHRLALEATPGLDTPMGESSPSRMPTVRAPRSAGAGGAELPAPPPPSAMKM